MLTSHVEWEFSQPIEIACEVFTPGARRLRGAVGVFDSYTHLPYITVAYSSCFILTVEMELRPSSSPSSNRGKSMIVFTTIERFPRDHARFDSRLRICEMNRTVFINFLYESFFQ